MKVQRVPKNKKGAKMEELRACGCGGCKLADKCVVLDAEMKRVKLLLAKKERLLSIRRHVLYTFNRDVQVHYRKDLKIDYVEAEVMDLQAALSKKQTDFVNMHTKIMQSLCECAKCAVTELIWP